MIRNHDDHDKQMDRQILEAIDIEAPAEDAYAQWTQFETFPQFMEKVERVRQVDDRRLRWTARIFGNEQEWSAEITEQIPGKRIAWRTTSGAEHAGVVTFHRLDDDHARLTVQIDYSPTGVVEKVGDRLGIVAHGVRRDLANFKEFIENRSRPTGAWEGSVVSPDERASGRAPLPPAAAGEAGKI